MRRSDLETALRNGEGLNRQRWSKVREVGQAGGVDRPELYGKHLWGHSLGLVWGYFDHQKVLRTGQPLPVPSLGKRNLEDQDVAQEDTGYRKWDLRTTVFPQSFWNSQSISSNIHHILSLFIGPSQRTLP